MWLSSQGKRWASRSQQNCQGARWEEEAHWNSKKCWWLGCILGPEGNADLLARNWWWELRTLHHLCYLLLQGGSWASRACENLVHVFAMAVWVNHYRYPCIFEIIIWSALTGSWSGFSQGWGLGFWASDTNYWRHHRHDCIGSEGSS